jgi:hypothetical protein
MKTTMLALLTLLILVLGCEVADPSEEPQEETTAGAAGATSTPSAPSAREVPEASEPEPQEEVADPIESGQLYLILTRDRGSCGDILSPLAYPPNPERCCEYDTNRWECEVPEGSYLSFARGTKWALWDYAIDENGDGWVSLTGLRPEGGIVCQARYRSEGFLQ